jgi:hypothetical protein
MKRLETTFYDEHPFDWTKGHSLRELDAALAALFKSFTEDVHSDVFFSCYQR